MEIEKEVGGLEEIEVRLIFECIQDSCEARLKRMKGIIKQQEVVSEYEAEAEKKYRDLRDRDNYLLRLFNPN